MHEPFCWGLSEEITVRRWIIEHWFGHKFPKWKTILLPGFIDWPIEWLTLIKILASFTKRCGDSPRRRQWQHGRPSGRPPQIASIRIYCENIHFRFSSAIPFYDFYQSINQWDVIAIRPGVERLFKVCVGWVHLEFIAWGQRPCTLSVCVPSVLVLGDMALRPEWRGTTGVCIAAAIQFHDDRDAVVE